jgi:hypothetical protein
MSGLDQSTVVASVAAAEAAVLLFLLARWYSRKRLGRNSYSRLRRYIRVTVVDLYRPVLQVYRFGRAVRLTGEQLADPRLSGVLHKATDVIGQTLAGLPGSWSYAVLATPNWITATIPGPLPTVPVEPWPQPAGRWSVNRAGLTALAAFPSISRSPCHVAIGVAPDGLLLIDLNRVPGVLEIRGLHRPVFSLICAIAAQLSAGLAGAASEADLEILITDGVHPRFTGPSLRELLQMLNQRLVPGLSSETTTVLVCGALEPSDADRIATLCAQIPTLRVITAGPYPGAGWKLPLSPAGRIVAPGLALLTDSAPLERGVARAIRLRRHSVDAAPASIRLSAERSASPELFDPFPANPADLTGPAEPVGPAGTDFAEPADPDTAPTGLSATALQAATQATRAAMPAPARAARKPEAKHDPPSPS